MAPGEPETLMPTVAFASRTFYGTAEQGSVVIGVMRYGCLETESQVHYGTESGSAKAGKAFETTQGTLTFAPGEDFKNVLVTLNADSWGMTHDFRVDLTEQDIKDCSLDNDLFTARVLIIGKQSFPSSRWNEGIFNEDTKEISGLVLLNEYCKLNRKSRSVRAGEMNYMLVDLLHNLYLVFKLFLIIYLVDFVIKGSESELLLVQNRQTWLWLLLVAILVPFVLLALLDQMRFVWKLEGTSCGLLQRSLLRKVLHYDDVTRGSVNELRVLMGLTQDVKDTVNSGFMTFVGLVKEIGKLLLITVFQFTVHLVFSRAFFLEQILLPTLAFPILMTLFLLVRRCIGKACFEKAVQSQKEVVEGINRTMEERQLILDYGVTERSARACEIVCKKYTGDLMSTQRILYNNMYFSRFVMALAVSACLVFNGHLVIGGDMTLGMFVAQVGVFVQMGEAWAVICKILHGVSEAVPALKRIARLQNLPSDLQDHQDMSDYSRNESRKWRLDQATRSNENGRILSIDLMPIKLTEVTLRPPGSREVSGSGSIMVVPGQMVALVGARGQGKAFMLKLLGGITVPKMSNGDPGFFLPSHLRIIHVSLDPCFVKQSLMENLTLGVVGGVHTGRQERVEKICERLGIDRDRLRLELSKQEDTNWGTVLSHTQKSLYNLARALIADPEVLCIHKPTQAFDAQLADRVMGCLAAFVKDRGLEHDPVHWQARRPRTLIFTSAQVSNMKYTDSVFHISRSEGIKALSKHEVTPGMLGGLEETTTAL